MSTTEGEGRWLTALYNPEERYGLIERFGPYEYLPVHDIFQLTFDTAQTDGDAYVRTTASRLNNWYTFHAKEMLLVDADETEIPDYEEAYAEELWRRTTDLTFRKVKAPIYEKEDLYVMADEAPGLVTGSAETAGITAGTTGMGSY